MANLLRNNVGANKGTILTTELNALGIGAYSANGPAYDNSTAALGDRWGVVDIVLPSLIVPAGAPYLILYLNYSLDGTTYSDVTSANQVGTHEQAVMVSVLATTSAKRIISFSFPLMPFKFKPVLYNGTGVALAGTLNTVTLWTYNENLNG